MTEVLESGWLTMGPRTEEFERSFAEHVGCEHAIAVSSCTAALHLALLAAGVGPGDEVIVPSMTFVATANAVRYCGATPVFAEIVRRRMTSTSTRRTWRLGSRIAPVRCMPVHFGGYPVGDRGGRRASAASAASRSSRTPPRPPHHASPVAASGRSGSRAASASSPTRPWGRARAAPCPPTRTRSPRAFARCARRDDAGDLRTATAATPRPTTWSRWASTTGSTSCAPRCSSSRLGRLHGEIERRNELIARYREKLAGIDGLTVAYDGFDLASSSGYLMW